jgi:5-(carboxyamino)imidazole ribonucleotide synthase
VTTGRVPVVGMVGAGQLARMTHRAAIDLGLTLRVLADAPDDSAARVTPDVVVGNYRDLADLRGFAAGCDVVTFDHEHVLPEHLAVLADEGVVLRPGPATLRHAQDKRALRETCDELKLPAPPWVPVGVVGDVERLGYPVVVKAVRGGYDGRGVWVAHSAGEVERLLATGTPLLAEELVPLRRELSAVVARSPAGQAAAYPVVETVQSDGICVEVLAPAPGLGEERASAAQELALRVAVELDVVGVLAVELFETVAGELLVNEFAMRPHNSGHWTIEGADTSQFEQHLRAVLDLPLGSPRMPARWVAVANVLGGADPDVFARLPDVLARDPAVKVHLYGKHVRPGRKIGHVTAVGDTLGEVRARATAAAACLRGPG